MRADFRKILGTRPLFIDGAMGTFLLQEGIPADICFETANVDYSDKVKKVHKMYVEAGADIIETNTFGGSVIKLEEYGLEDQAYELNKKGVELAREIAGEDRYVMASMGPCGKLIAPMGNVTYDEVYESFSVQAKAFKDGGADLVIVETMGDIHEVKAGVRAIQDNTDLPIICSVTYDGNYYNMTGSDPYTVFVTLSAMGVDVIGTNCGMGPQGMIHIVKEYARAKKDINSSSHISVMPNAGLPVLENGKAVYKMQPEEYSSFSSVFLEEGASLFGGCCGTSPAHINAVKNKLEGKTLKLVQGSDGLSVLTTRSSIVNVSDQHPPVVIGERLNPTARKILVEDLLEQKTDLYYKEAKLQVDAGTDLLDVNVGYPDINEASAMSQIVEMLNSKFSVPLCVDSSDPYVIEEGLKVYPGKALVNSVNGEEKSIRSVLPLVKKYGAAVIGLTLDEKGIPSKAEDRFEIAEKIVTEATKIGISKNDIFIDALVLAASSNQDDALETIKAVSMIKEKLGVKTSLGLSNISHGLPKRKLINHTYMTMAFGAGLDAVIANPADPYVKSIIYACSVINGRDVKCENYISAHEELLVAQPGDSQPIVTKSSVVAGEPESLKQLKQQSEELYNVANFIIKGEGDQLLSVLKDVLKKHTPAEIMEKGLLSGMDIVGERFKSQKVFLPQVMSSAEAMKAAFKVLKPMMSQDSSSSKGTVVIATVKGDIHDIGKNIVAMMLENKGFNVVDLGKNVESDDIIDAAVSNNASIICLSSLLTTTMTEMEVVCNKVKERKLNIEVMVGGAVVTQKYAGRIGANYSEDAVGASELAESLSGVCKECQGSR